MKTIYVVLENADMTEGRGPMVPIAYFTHEKDAIQHANQFCGVMGQKPDNGWENEKYGDLQIKPIAVYDSFLEANKENQEKVKKAALEKLTPYEKQLLGLDK